MSYTTHEEKSEDGFFTLKVISDDDPLNPRVDYDNAGHMVCFHRRYDLGDKVHYDLPEGVSYLRDSEEDEENDYEAIRGEGTFRDDDVDSARRFAAEVAERGGVVLPLFLYDHSGITMSTGSFACRWDSGQVGFIYVLKEEIDAEWDGDVERAEKYLKGEVETYDQYLTGDVWGYVIEDEDGEHIESCWGFFGDKYAVEEGQSMLKSVAEDAAKKRAVDEKEENEQGAIRWCEETWRSLCV